MKHNSFLLAVVVAAACISVPAATSAANLSTAAGLANIVPAWDVQLAHNHPFQHCHACAGRYICHRVGPTPVCRPSGRVYRAPTRPR